MVLLKSEAQLLTVFMESVLSQVWRGWGIYRWMGAFIGGYEAPIPKIRGLRVGSNPISPTLPRWKDGYRSNVGWLLIGDNNKYGWTINSTLSIQLEEIMIVARSIPMTLLQTSIVVHVRVSCASSFTKYIRWKLLRSSSPNIPLEQELRFMGISI